VRWLAILMIITFTSGLHADTRLKVRLGKAGGGKALAGVGLVDASTTEIVTGASLSAPFRTTLHAPPGVYHLIGDVSRLGRVSGALGTLFAVGDEKKLRSTLALATITPTPAPMAHAVTLANGAGPVATMGDVIVVVPGVGGQTFDAAFLTVLFQRTKDNCGLTWVDSSRQFLAQRDIELALQASGRLDPSTPVFDNRIFPTVRVEGSFLDDGDTVSGELRLIDIATDTILHRQSLVSKRARFYREYPPFGEAFADEMTRILCPSTTTTTTSTTSTTSTTVAGGSCTPGDSAGCAATECCHPTTHTCCDPFAPGCGQLVSDCCGLPDVPLQTDFCGGPGSPATCPVSCQSGQVYRCTYCDGRIVEEIVPQ
jgi:hypothetical protein